MKKKNNCNYDFDLILSNESFKENKEKCLQIKNKTKKCRKLKKWVKPLLLLIIGAVVGIAIYQLFTLKVDYITPAGNYTCTGGIIKICTGTSSVADYIGA